MQITKKTIMMLSILFFVASICCVLSPNVNYMLAGRFALGIAVGGVSVTVPTYLAEISPTKRRGKFVTRNEFMIVSGQLLAFIFNAIIAISMGDSGHVWRYMLSLAVLPAVVLGLGMIKMPESPRWLISKGKIEAVRGIDLHVDEGEILGIVGESGSGKSVAMKSVMGLLPDYAKVESGGIFFKGEDLSSKTEKELLKYRGGEIAMIFQDPMTSLNPTMTVGKQIMESLRIHRHLDKKQAREEAIKMLKMVNIPSPEKRIDSYPHEMSGGMRQRVMIAMALACSPKILIADEPTTALDVTIQAQIMDLMRELKEKMNTAIILVTHDLGVVANFADRIQVMYAGQVVERGTAREIFYDSKHPYTWALLSSVPKLAKESKQELYALKGTPPDLILPLNHCPFASRCEYCMPICKEKNPLETTITDTHRVSCWLQHPNAPKVKSFYDREAK